MHFLFRKGFFSALRSLISFGMKNDKSGLDQRLRAGRTELPARCTSVCLAESGLGSICEPDPRKGGACGGRGGSQLEEPGRGAEGKGPVFWGSVEHAACSPGAARTPAGCAARGRFPTLPGRALGGTCRPACSKPGEPPTHGTRCKSGPECGGPAFPGSWACRGWREGGPTAPQQQLVLASAHILEVKARGSPVFRLAGAGAPTPRHPSDSAFRAGSGSSHSQESHQGGWEGDSAPVTEVLPYGRGAALSAVFAFCPRSAVRASRRKGVDGRVPLLRQHSYFPHVNALWVGKGAGPRGRAAGAGAAEGSAEPGAGVRLCPTVSRVPRSIAAKVHRARTPASWGGLPVGPSSSNGVSVCKTKVFRSVPEVLSYPSPASGLRECSASREPADTCLCLSMGSCLIWTVGLPNSVALKGCTFVYERFGGWKISGSSLGDDV